MIYNILRPIVRFALKLYFGKIYLVGLDKIPKDKPIILASNHPTAFIEPCMLACFLPNTLHFLVRGDLFSKPWLSWLLVGTNQIPIFRQKDGMDNVRKNLITQEKLYKLFEENKTLLMFPEAHTHENLFLRPLKKGISRFAFMDHGTDLQVVPIGVNFDRHVKFASKVSIVVGESLSIKDYNSKNFETDALKHRSFINDLEDSMKECLRHIEIEENEDSLYKAYHVMDSIRGITPVPSTSTNGDRFQDEKRLASLADTEDKWINKIHKIVHGHNIKRLQIPNFWDIILMVITLPLFGVSLIFHTLSVQISRLIVAKKITAHEFLAPVFMAMMIFQYIVYIPVALIIIIFGGLTWKIIALLFLLSGIWGTLYLKLFQDKWKYLFEKSDNKSWLKSLSDDWPFSENI